MVQISAQRAQQIMAQQKSQSESQFVNYGIENDLSVQDFAKGFAKFNGEKNLFSSVEQRAVVENYKAYQDNLATDSSKQFAVVDGFKIPVNSLEDIENIRSKYTTNEDGTYSSQPNGGTSKFDPEDLGTGNLRTQFETLKQLDAEIDNYRTLISNYTTDGKPVQLVGKEAAEISSANAAIKFLVAQASGTGALQEADAKIVEDILVNPSGISGAFKTLTRGGRDGNLASIDQAKGLFKNRMLSLTGQDSFGATPPPKNTSSPVTTDNALQQPLAQNQQTTQQNIQQLAPQIEPEKEQEVTGALNKFMSGLSKVTGADVLGKAIGDNITAKLVTGDLKDIQKELDKIDVSTPQGKARYAEIQQELGRLNQVVDTVDKKTFGQIAGSMVQIGSTFVGGAAATAATKLGKVVKGGLSLAGQGAVFGGAEAAADGDNIVQGAITGGIFAAGGGALLGTAGKGVSATAGAINDKLDFTGRSQKLAAEILQPTKKEMTEILQKPSVGKDGKVLSQNNVITALTKHVERSKTFKDLKGHLSATTSALFDERNKILQENNYDITDQYLNPLKNKIKELKENQVATPSQIKAAETRLAQEQDYINSIGGTMTRLQGQARKEAIQDSTEPLLKKKQSGSLSADESNDKVALDAIRQGLRLAVNGSDDRVIAINQEYKGLKRAVELIAGRESDALKAEDIGILQKIAMPVIELFTSTTGAGSAAFVARRAANTNKSLDKLTKELKDLSEGRGGVFTDIYKGVSDFAASAKGASSKAGQKIKDLDGPGKPKTLKGSLGVGAIAEDISSPFRNALQKSSKSSKGVKIDGKTIRQVDEPTKKELIEAIDYIRTGEEFDKAKDRIVTDLAEKYGIKQDQSSSKIANIFEKLVENTKTSDTLPGTKK